MRLRKAMINAAVATQPYSISITQEGSVPQEPVAELKCHMTYTGMTLTVQISISQVEGELRKGSSQRRYQGNTTGAKTSDAAMGQAKALTTQGTELHRGSIVTFSL